MRKVLTSVLVIAALAAPVLADEEKPDVKVSFYDQIQVIGEFKGKAVGEGQEAAGDILLRNRRTRLMVQGNYGIFSFTTMLHADNLLGTKGAGTNPGGIAQVVSINKDVQGQTVGVREAYGTVKAMGEALMVDLGFLQYPLRSTNISNSAAIGVEYGYANTALGSGGRDTGLQFRGVVLNKLLEYRLGVFHGQQYLDTSAVSLAQAPAFAGQLRFNLLGEADTSFYKKGYYLDKQSLVAIGVAGLYQKKGVHTAGTTDMDLTIGEAFLNVNYVLGTDAIVLDVLYEQTKSSPVACNADILALPALSYKCGTSRINAAVGYYMGSLKLMPTIGLSKNMGDLNATTKVGSQLDLEISLGWFPMGHNLNLKAAYVHKAVGDAATGSATLRSVAIRDQDRIVIQAERWEQRDSCKVLP
jgi:hypothetical protein